MRKKVLRQDLKGLQNSMVLLGKCEAPEKALRQTEYSVRQVRFQDSKVEGRS